MRIIIPISVKRSQPTAFCGGALKYVGKLVVFHVHNPKKRATGSRTKSTEEAAATPRMVLYLEANMKPRYEIVTQATAIQTGGSREPVLNRRAESAIFQRL